MITAPERRAFPESFERGVEKWPDRIAASDQRTSVTYRALNAYANQLAHRLTAENLGRARRVGVCCEPSLELATAVLAVFKAGAVYVALDPTHPREALHDACCEGEVSFILTDNPSRLCPNGSAAPVKCLSIDWPPMVRHGSDNPARPDPPGDIACLFYTSGSAGAPKAVQIDHAALSYYGWAMNMAVPRTFTGIGVQTASCASVTVLRQLLVPLMHGGTVVFTSPQAVRDPSLLCAHIARHASPVVHVVPSVWEAMVDYLEGLPSAHEHRIASARWKSILSGGDHLSSTLVERWRQIAGVASIVVNMYGQTETTGIVALYQVPQTRCREASVPIGHPIPQTQLHILDDRMGMVADGESGELCVCGPGLARGYLNNDAKTREQFIDSPFESGGRLYRTGDVGRRLHDGTIAVTGRRDNQIKLRGVRIDLEAIEALLRVHPGVKAAAVAVRPLTSRSRILVAYVVSSRPVDRRELKAFLRRRLPHTMLPGLVMELDHLPLTSTGKIDRGSLPAPRSRVIE